MIKEGIKRLTLCKAVLVSALLCIVPSVGTAGEWRVTPIRLDLGKDAKSGVITVVNDGGDRLSVQMKAFEWTQDSEGKDQYAESEELIFFPKIMAIEKKEERILRVGIKIPAATKEKAYRLFIEEIPEPKKGEGAQVAISVRFGVPIFVKPPKEDMKGEIEGIRLSKGVIGVAVRNAGNKHFIINALNIKGKNIKGEETYAKEISGWYLLAGASRLYTAQIPHDTCNDIAGLEIDVKTSDFTLNGKLDVDKSMCIP